MQNNKATPPPLILLPILIKLKELYAEWQRHLVLFPKTSKYTLGYKLDAIFIEIIEAVSTAAFLDKQQKLPYLRLALRKLDITKILLQMSWEIKSLNDKRYTNISEKIGAVGRMLGGWHNQLVKQNSPN